MGLDADLLPQTTARPAVGSTRHTSAVRSVCAMGAAASCTVALLCGLLRVCAALTAEVAAQGPASPPAALTLTAAAASLVLASWLSLGTLLALVECLPGRAGHAARWLGR